MLKIYLLLYARVAKAETNECAVIVCLQLRCNVINKRAKINFWNRVDERMENRKKLSGGEKKKKIRVAPSNVPVKVRPRNETFIEEDPRPV